MSDVPPTDRPVPPAGTDPTATQSLPGQPPPATSPRPRWRERLWGLRAVVAVALASVILGGLGGAALAQAGGQQDGRSGPGRGQFGPGGHRGPGGGFGRAPGQQGQQGRQGQQLPPGQQGGQGNQGGRGNHGLPGTP